MSTRLDHQTIPFLDLKAQYQPLMPEIRAAMEAVFADTGFVLGPRVEAFELAFARYCQSSHCVTVHSGTAALHLALLALDIGPGDEVITVSNTFIATAEAISFVGATPRFVDVDPVTRTMDVSQVEAAITQRTRAILPVHLYGQPAPMAPILALAKAHNLYVIEDACQAHGAMYHGKRVGSLGDIGCFSFYPGKNLGAAGEGGAIVTSNPEWAEKIRLIRDHGAPQKYQHRIIGHNFRLDALQAAILSIKLPHLDVWNAARRSHAANYTRLLQTVPGIKTPVEPEETQSVYHLYVVQVPHRARVIEAFQQHGIQYGIHYPVPVHLQEAYSFMGLLKGSLPVTEALADGIISLPMYPELTHHQQERVVEVLAGALAQTNGGV